MYFEIANIVTKTKHPLNTAVGIFDTRGPVHGVNGKQLSDLMRPSEF